MIDHLARRTRRRRGARGYTLLEVLIALAVLAIALTALLGAMGASSQQSVFATDLTVASQLARSQMIDLEYELMREGFSLSEQRFRGDFARQGHPEMTWEATVQPVEIPDNAREELLARVNSQLFGGVEGDGALQGNAAFSTMLPMLIGKLPELINQIGMKLRRINLSVSFPMGPNTHTLEVNQYVVDQSDGTFNLFGAMAPPATTP